MRLLLVKENHYVNIDCIESIFVRKYPFSDEEKFEVRLTYAGTEDGCITVSTWKEHADAIKALNDLIDEIRSIPD